ncbi:maleylpyruvate isomerase N-terminal domain-containing protein [Allobranchiibius sp. GilTou38]|uniref:maleylpyruvate isomerase N-terminal domain-containing protein n=1 Tax=Allobranchiibius sp. GilTou38 TaxID=2815210 RepID=UPI001FB699A2|nr:maleylpyruvate isomerase N-terminal domain-containing protein [Allobranchiibius sp. GilTou38]
MIRREDAERGELSAGRSLGGRPGRAGRALGDDPAAGFGALVDQVGAELASADPAAVITTIAGGMTVDTYLPTRTFELVVHGLDICAAADLPTTFTPASLNETCALAGRIAARAGRGPPRRTTGAEAESHAPLT